MKIEFLKHEEMRFAEKLGRDIVIGKLKGTINLIDELEKLKADNI